jgi:hypothetical protein
MPAIELSNSHLIIDARIAAQILGPQSHVNLVYYPKYNSIFLASATDELFKALHKTTTAMIKSKNNLGDKSISIQEIVIDNNIDPTNRILNFKADFAMKVISVFFNGHVPSHNSNHNGMDTA